MELKRKLQRLERKGIISKKPHPSIPFILAFISLALGLFVLNSGLPVFLSSAFFSIAIFSFVFALLHLAVVITLEK